jgi:uncharacterized protein (TIGR03000 family)
MDVPDCHRRGGCHGCSGGCYGGWGGCYGGGWGGCSGGYYGGGCYGGYYGGGHYGGGFYQAPARMPPAGGDKAPTPRREGKGGAEEQEGPAPGSIEVKVPADARITVDGAPTQSTSSHRVFVTSPLAPGYNYYFVLRAEVQRNGQTLTQTQRITVLSGQMTPVALDPGAPVVSAGR